MPSKYCVSNFFSLCFFSSYDAPISIIIPSLTHSLIRPLFLAKTLSLFFHSLISDSLIPFFFLFFSLPPPFFFFPFLLSVSLFPLSIYLSVYLSVSFSLCLFISPCHSLSLPATFSLSLSLSVSLCLSLSLSTYLSLSFSMSHIWNTLSIAFSFSFFLLHKRFLCFLF